MNYPRNITQGLTFSISLMFIICDVVKLMNK